MSADISSVETILQNLNGISSETIRQYLVQREQEEKTRLIIHNLHAETLSLRDQDLLLDLERALVGVNSFTQDFNQRFGPTVTIDNSKLEEIRHSPNAAKIKISENYKRDGDGKLVGLLHRPTIHTLNDLVGSIFTTTKEIVAETEKVQTPSRQLIVTFRQRKCRELIEGLMQSGKTSAFVGAYLIIPTLIYVLTKGRLKAVCSLSVPPLHSVCKNTLTELRGAKGIYGKIIFRHQDFACSIDDYWAKLASSPAFTGMNKKNQPHEDIFDVLVIKRTPSSCKEAKAQLSKFIEAGFDLIFVFTDEGHFGADRKGIQRTLSRAIKNARNPGGPKVYISEVVITATADEIKARNVKRHWGVTTTPIGPHFCGPAFIDGKPVPTVDCDGPEGSPQVEAIDAHLKKIGAYLYPMVEGAYFAGISAFPKIMKKHGLNVATEKLSWEVYRDYFIGALITIARHNLNWDREEWAIFHRFKTNARCDALIEHMTRFLTPEEREKFEFCRFYGRDSSPVKIVCQNNAFKHGKYAIIFATANARLSCPFPRVCTTYLDFTESTSTADALLQGTYGRACGYHKIINGKLPLVLTSTGVAKQFHQMEEAHFRLESHNKRPGIRSRRTIGGEPRRGTWNQTLLILESPYPEVRAIVEPFNKAWVHGRLCKSDPRDPRSLASNALLKEFFCDDFLERAPQYLSPERRHFKFLKWRQLDQSPEKYGTMHVSTYPGDNIPALIGFTLRIEQPSDDGLREIRPRSTSRKANAVQSIGPRNSKKWESAVAPSVSLRFRPKPCPNCGERIDLRLWRLHTEMDVAMGTWPVEIRRTCCFRNSEVDIIAINFRLAEEGIPKLPTGIGYEATWNSRFFADAQRMELNEAKGGNDEEYDDEDSEDDEDEDSQDNKDENDDSEDKVRDQNESLD